MSTTTVRRGRPVTAATDNNTVRELRAQGFTFRQIADCLDIGIASAHRAITPERPKRRPIAANDNHCEVEVPFNGGYSTTSGMVPVTLARVPTLERPEIQVADERVAA